MNQAVGAEESCIKEDQMCMFLCGGKWSDFAGGKGHGGVVIPVAHLESVDRNVPSEAVSASGYTSDPGRKNGFVSIHLLELENVP